MRTYFCIIFSRITKRKIQEKSEKNKLQTLTPTFQISLILKFHVTWTTGVELVSDQKAKQKKMKRKISENPAITEQWSWTDYLKLHSSFLKVSKSRKQILKFSFEPKNRIKYFCISALASTKRSNQKNKGTLLLSGGFYFDSLLNYFFDLTSFL